MSPLYYLQYLLFCFCVQLFTIFSYLVYYSDRLYFQNNIQDVYDYIIVGSGTAGSIIAHRLSTETNYSFIVLEAGSHSHFMLDIPVLAPFLHRSVFDWKFETVPQEDACLAFKNHKCRMPQGKIVGGSSKLNNMIYIRGNISHYVDWFHGKHTKEYILKQFKYIEENILTIDEIQYESELSNAVLESAHELGYRTLDHNFGEGFMKTKLTQKNGKRWSTSDLLSQHIITNAMVEKVVFTGNTATGVSVAILNKNYRIHGRKGVILSAGTINTPKILQLSGIGPENVLKPLNIPIVKVLPVGQNLQDHVATGLDLVLFNKSVSINAFDMVNPINAINYFINGQGPLTTSGCEAIGFVSTKNEQTPNLQFMILPVGLSSDRGSLFSKNLGLKDEIFHNYFVDNIDKFAASFLPLVLHPKSKGEVFITSKDVDNPPIFDPKYLSNIEDRNILIDGLKIVIKMLETKTLIKIGGYLNMNHFPGCEMHKLFSDSYFECYIKHLTLTSYHPIGTCSMGLPGEKNTVVDTSFKVLGLNNLFVADASVLPTLPSGNINAAVAMMANIFFNTNIIIHNDVKTNYFCSKKDFVYEVLFKICRRKRHYIIK